VLGDERKREIYDQGGEDVSARTRLDSGTSCASRPDSISFWNLPPVNGY
jgi:hypothetical protein